ncbi:MAG: carbohydrate ABC transporter permease [Actinobacteria bacterium]|nr:carbohydrate ABC transporter permease [Actinomycetota bacterium]
MKKSKLKRTKHIPSRIVTYIVLAIFFIPVLWLILTSFRTHIEINTRPPIWIPKNINFDSYLALLGFGVNPEQFGFGENVPFGYYVRNSLIAATASTLLALVIGTLAGYAFSSFKFRGRNGIFLSLMLARAIPGIALSLPLLVLFTKLGLSDKVYGLIIAYTAMNVPFTAWLMAGFIGEIPEELNDAALIDGCSRWSAFLKVDLPLIGPGLAASGIFAFLISWNEFAIASVITRTIASKTFPLGLFDFTAEFVSDWRGMCAMSVLMLVPAIIFVIIVQRHLVKGLTLGALKG